MVNFFNVSLTINLHFWGFYVARAGHDPDAPKVTYMGQRMCKCTNEVLYSVLCGLVSQLARICHLGGIGRTRHVHPWVRTTWAAMCVLWANTHAGSQVLHLVPVSTKQGRFQSKLVCEPFARALHVHPAP